MQFYNFYSLYEFLKTQNMASLKKFLFRLPFACCNGALLINAASDGPVTLKASGLVFMLMILYNFSEFISLFSLSFLIIKKRKKKNQKQNKRFGYNAVACISF